MAKSATTKILLAEIKKEPNATTPNLGDDTDDTPLKLDHKLWKENLDNYHLQQLNFDENETQAGKICNGSICCEYNVTATTRNSDPVRTVCIFW